MTTEEQTSSAPRDRHGLILEYLRTAPAVLGGLAALLGALTTLIALLAQ
ncbi:hypothetical protein ACGGAQ_18475 [Micromonospora sp. NPDC047557]